MIQKLKNNRIVFGVLLVLFVYFAMKMYFNIDSDFYHIATSGKWIVQHKTLQYINDQFVGDGYETIIQQWLYAVFLYETSKLGRFGVATFTFVQFIALFVVCYSFLRRFKLDKKTSCLTVMCALMLIETYVVCRPQMISLILLVLQLIAIENYRTQNNKKFLYCFPLIMLLEINLHGTFWIFHYLVILPYIVPFDKLLKQRTKVTDTNMAIKPFLLPILLMTVALFVNPYGYKMITCLFSSSSIADLDIIELQPITITSQYCVPTFISIVASAFLYSKKKMTSTTLYMSIGFILLELIAMRNLMFNVIIALFLVKDAMKDVDTNRFYKYLNDSLHPVLERIIITFGILIVIIFQYCQIAIGTKKLPEQQAIEYLQNAEDDLQNIKLYTGFNNGAYFLWEGVGKIYIQAKTEPYVKGVNGKKDITQEYIYLLKYSNNEGVQKFLKTYNFDYLYLTSDDHILQVYLENDEDYECVLQGDDVKVCKNYKEPEFYLYKKVKE